MQYVPNYSLSSPKHSCIFYYIILKFSLLPVNPGEQLVFFYLLNLCIITKFWQYIQNVSSLVLAIKSTRYRAQNQLKQSTYKVNLHTTIVTDRNKLHAIQNKTIRLILNMHRNPDTQHHYCMQPIREPTFRLCGSTSLERQRSSSLNVPKVIMKHEPGEIWFKWKLIVECWLDQDT